MNIRTCLRCLTLGLLLLPPALVCAEGQQAIPLDPPVLTATCG